jgi:superfamily I DNA and/or RNA helicase
VAEANRNGWPQRYEECEALREDVRHEEPGRARLERQHEELLAALDKLRHNAEMEIIRQARFVATTLARFRLHPAVYGGQYDVVLVDEVGAAAVPEVLLAVAKARETAVLLGDFLQLGPVGLDEVRRQQRPDVQRWLGQDAFGVCGIGTPAEAVEHPGCVVLDVQYRFGPEVMELANRVMYRRTLRAGVKRSRAPDDPEVILLDTDHLGDLGILRRSGRAKGWWPAGSLLARTLAQYHMSEEHDKPLIGVTLTRRFTLRRGCAPR